ncbi:MAG: hypothetical protein JSV26_10030 [bacterium]|nr:MAG: hypothetical protein JSV26_10030 [bacterium]
MVRTIIAALVLYLAGTSPAFAVDTTKTYNSGILVSIFLGVCALIVIAQLVPALVLLMGGIKALISGRTRKEATVAVESGRENG